MDEHDGRRDRQNDVNKGYGVSQGRSQLGFHRSRQFQTIDEENDQHKQDRKVTKQGYDLFHPLREKIEEEIKTGVFVVSQTDAGPQKGHPDEGKGRELLGPVKGGFQQISTQNLQKDEDRHGRY